MKCGCRAYGNQYGSYYQLCEEHSEVLELAAATQGTTAVELFNQVVLDYVTKVVNTGEPDADA